MIRYALRCETGHGFESWFQGSAAYEDQVRKGLVSCPVCGSQKIEKAIMAPRLAASSKRRASERSPRSVPVPAEANSQVAVLSPAEQEFGKKLKELRDHIVSNADYVGRQFPAEARRMHYGDAEHRSIYGEASGEEAAALAEEGIEFHHLPRLPDERN